MWTFVSRYSADYIRGPMVPAGYRYAGRRVSISFTVSWHTTSSVFSTVPGKNAGPSTTLRSGRDDNSVAAAKISTVQFTTAKNSHLGRSEAWWMDRRFFRIRLRHQLQPATDRAGRPRSQ